MNYPDLLEEIMLFGHTAKPHGREIREVVKTQIEIEPDCNIYAWPSRPIEKITGYWMKEVAWYMSGDRGAEYISKHAGLWEKIKNKDGTLNSNYGFLVFYTCNNHPSLGNVSMNPFQWALRCLQKDKDSRQAVITYNSGGYNYPTNDDYICTQHQSFLIRNNVLRCFVALRSSDAIFGLPYNMPWWSLVHQQLYLYLKDQYPYLELGSIEVDIYSAHIYAHHYELVEDMLAEQPQKYKMELLAPIPIAKGGIDWYEKHITDYVKIREA